MNVCVCRLYFLIFSLVPYVSFVFSFFLIFGIFVESEYITRNKSSHVKVVEQSLDVLPQRWSIFPTHPRLRVLSPHPSPYTLLLFSFLIYTPFFRLFFVSFFFILYTSTIYLCPNCRHVYVYKQALRHRRRTPTVSR